MHLNTAAFAIVMYTTGPGIAKTLHCLALLVILVLAGNTAFAQSASSDEYVIVGYQAEATDNPVAILAGQLARGETRLAYQEARGYLDALLEALNIDMNSQVLVFSKTSLQYQKISAATPRAVYFSEDTYIGWVQNSTLVEIATLDSKLGLVFYLFNNRPDPAQYVVRESQRCLVCHDSNGTMGGGVPLLLAHSSVYSLNYDNLLNVTGDYNTSDTTPVQDRWGGWYVSGEHGDQPHLGNLLLPDKADLVRLDAFRRGNLRTLADQDLFDTSPYLAATSDIVALMVMEHQLTVQNQLTYVKFKAPAVLERVGHGEARNAMTWDALPERARLALTHMLDNLVDDLLLVDAAQFEDEIHGSPEFVAWFQAQGPSDDQGRSLRDLDLKRNLFAWPLSYLVYSPAMANLPGYARDYVFRQITAKLSNPRLSSRQWTRQWSARQRQTALAILNSTLASQSP